MIFTSAASASAAWSHDIQIHARSGFINGKYDGVFSGKFQLSGALDLEVEMFTANKAAFIFRFIQAMDSPDSRPFYTYAGSGGKYYFWGRGNASQQESTTGSISARPTLRAYVGGDFGVAQVLVKSFGPTVQAVANMVDAGANLGAIYQIGKNFGIEAQAGFSVGYGMSSTTANGYTERLLLGMTYLF